MEIGLSLSLLLLFLLILLNGFFSGAEIALIALRKSRTQTLIEEGRKRARLIGRLQSNPDNFFATVQIGVTLVSVFNGFFAGSNLSHYLVPYLDQLPYIQTFSNEIAMILLVVGITYLSLVFGELVPKSLALHHSERFALAIIYPLHIFSRFFYLFTRLLTFTSNLVLRPFHDRTSFSATHLSPEEILLMVEEGVRAGTIRKTEHELIENVLEINDKEAREVMVPRVDIKAIPLDLNSSEFPELIHAFFSRLPIYERDPDNIIGILHIKDLMRSMVGGKPVSISRLARPAYFVPETMKIGNILKEMQKRKTHLAIVVDEHGGTAGLLTMEDILEEIVGEIEEWESDPEEHKIIPQSDGSYLVHSSCSVIDFNEYFETNGGFDEELIPELPESDSYTSVGGFVIKMAGRFPEVGEKIEAGKIVFELVRRVKQRLVLLKLTRNESFSEGIKKAAGE